MGKKPERMSKPLADRVSAYGVALDSDSGVDAPIIANLAAVGIADAEQIVAVAAIDGMKDHLAEQLGVTGSRWTSWSITSGARFTRKCSAWSSIPLP